MKKLCDIQKYRQSIAEVARRSGDISGTILITGATGLVGSCLADILLASERNIKIYALSRSIARLRERFSYAEGDGRLVFVEGDIRDRLEIDEHLDFIIHAASNADPRSYALYPTETLLSNVTGTENILRLCLKNKGCRLIYTSTFEVYGKAWDVDEYDEQTFGRIDCMAVRSCYPESKRAAETLIKCFGSEYGIDAVVARLCSVYGPTMTKGDNKAHAEFIANAVRGEDIVLKSKGQQRRTYAYVMDVADALLFLLKNGHSGEAYNVCNEAAVASIAEIAETAADIAGTRVVYTAPTELEAKGYSRPQNCILKNGKIKALGWSARYGIRQGLEECIDILKQI